MLHSLRTCNIAKVQNPQDMFYFYSLSLKSLVEEYLIIILNLYHNDHINVGVYKHMNKHQ